MTRLAVYPGSFDPPTLGHLDVVERAARLFDRLTVAVGRNATKRGLLSVEDRCEALRQATTRFENVSVDSYEGLTVDYVERVGASVIVRGLRATADFEYEYQSTLVNRMMRPSVETVFLMTSPELGYLSSSIVREVALLGGDYSGMVPPGLPKYSENTWADVHNRSVPHHPGPVGAAMLEELGRYVVATPYPFGVDLSRSEGMWLATVDGQRLFDWAGYFGSKLIGHNHPGLYAPAYVERLVRAANNKVANPDFLTLECLEYYRMLYRLAPEIMRSDRLEVYAVNSGAEAVENMMKYLVAMHNAKGKGSSGRRFLYFDKAFHGRTVFALGVTQTTDPVATKDFRGLGGVGNIKLPFPAFDGDRSPTENAREVRKALEQVESALRLMADEIVGIIVEPIQGAGGQRVALPSFFQGLSELAHRYDVYLAFDEVQTGLGATGRMWGLDHFDLPYPPQSVASGKKFGNGVVFMRESLEDVGVLDSTWGGSLADMVRVVREVEIVDEEGLIARAAVNGERLAEGLRSLAARHGVASNVRGFGLYQGLSLDSAERKAAAISVAREEFDLLLLGAGVRSLRTRPNLSVTADEIDDFLERLDGVLAAIA